MDNVPPWDTWIAFTEQVHPRPARTLLSYVPAAFVPAVERGIHVNPEECLLWADDDRLHALWLSGPAR